MATVVGYDNSNARAFEQLLALGMNADQKRRNREFEQARYLNSIGKNQEAEQLLAQSQRSGLGNLFAGEAEARKFNSAFGDLNPADRALIEEPKLNAQQEILAELQGLYDGDQAGYQQNMQALAGDMTNRGIQEQGISTNNGRISQPMWNDAAALFGQNLQGIKGNEQAIQRQAQVQLQNEAIKQANANKPYKAVLEGDEEDIINAETENAYRAIQNADSYDDKLRAYGKYVNSLTSKRRSFQGDFRPLSLEQMGVIKSAPAGRGSGGGASEKPERAYVYDQDGKRIESVLLTKSEFNDPNRNKILFDKYKTIAGRGGDPSLINVSFASGTSKEPDPMDIAAIKEVERQKTAKDQNAVKMLNQVTGWDVGSSDATKIYNDSEAREWLISRGYEIVEKPDGKYTIKKPQERNTQVETRNTIPLKQNKSVSDWLE